MSLNTAKSSETRFESLKNYLIPKNIGHKERERSENKLLEIMDKYGPVIDDYPSWHPLVTHHDPQYPQTYPNESCGYKGLDHTRYFLNAFITCPYSDGQEILESVDSLPHNNIATITAERLDIQLYNYNATPILVSCIL